MTSLPGSDHFRGVVPKTCSHSLCLPKLPLPSPSPSPSTNHWNTSSKPLESWEDIWKSLVQINPQPISCRETLAVSCTLTVPHCVPGELLSLGKWLLESISQCQAQIFLLLPLVQIMPLDITWHKSCAIPASLIKYCSSVNTHLKFYLFCVTCPDNLSHSGLWVP